MSFFYEVAKSIGLDELNLSSGYSVINYNGEAVYIEGVIRLLSVGDECIEIELRGARVSLIGLNLYIKELSQTIIVFGQIKTMEFIKKEIKEKSRSRGQDDGDSKK